MPVTLGELATLVGGELRGQAELLIDHALPLRSHLPAACLTLVDKAQSLDALRSSNATAVVAPMGLTEIELPAILVASPHAAFEQVIKHLRPARPVLFTGIHPAATIDSTAKIGNGVSIAASAVIGPGCTIGNNSRIHHGVSVMADCSVGDNCELFPGVVLYPTTRLGNRCTLHACCVLGAIGFGYRTTGGKHLPSAQLGWVELEDDVELGAAVTIDRGTYGPTRVGEGTKIDNQVMIGHNCNIGRHNLICAHVGIAGSSTTGDYVVLAGQVGIKDHIRIGDKVVVAAQSGVMHDLENGGVFCGTPAIPVKKHMQSVAQVQRLTDTRNDVKALQQQVAQLQKQVEQLLARDAGQSGREQRAA